MTIGEMGSMVRFFAVMLFFSQIQKQKPSGECHKNNDASLDFNGHHRSPPSEYSTSIIDG